MTRSPFGSLYNRRKLLGASLAGATAAALPRATRTGAQSTSLELLTVTNQPHVEEMWDLLISEFQEAHPGVTINRVSVPFDQYTARMATLIATGSGVDVFQLDVFQIPELTFRNLLLPLDPYYDQSETDLLVDIAAQVTTYQGVRYAAPVWESSQALFYNVDLLEEAGIAPPTSSADRWTWDQFLEVANELSSPPDRFGLVVQQWNRPYQIWPLLQSNGTGSLEDVIDIENLATAGRLNSETSIEALRFYGDLYNVHNVAPQSPIPEAFEAGIAAMFLAIPTVMPLFAQRAPDLNWAATYHPFFDHPVTPCTSWNLGVSSGVSDPDLAAELVRYLTSPETDQRWFEVANYLPVYKATYERIPELFPADTRQGAVYAITNEELQTTAIARPQVPGYGVYEDRFRAAIENVVNGGDAEDELNDAVDQIDRELARYRG